MGFFFSYSGFHFTAPSTSSLNALTDITLGKSWPIVVILSIPQSLKEAYFPENVILYSELEAQECL